MIISLLTLLLISNALALAKDRSILFSRFALLTLLCTAFIAWDNLYVDPLNKGVAIYGGLFHITTYTQSFNIFIFIITAIILTLTAFYPRKIYINEYSSIYKLMYYKLIYNYNIITNKMGEQFRIIEYALITIFILCGAVFLISTADIISIFLSIELQSYGLYIISTLYRDSESSTSSGLTYFLLGGLSSCFILLGSALLYANSGTTHLENMYIITSISKLYVTSNYFIFYESLYIHLSLIIMFVGFLFKISAAPFHFWSPDVYDGIPTIVTTYVAIIAKISILAFFLELVYYTEYNFFSTSLKDILLLSSLLSLIIGSILGLTQSRIKRLLAYSTISHIGFILLALSVNSAESIQSYIFYIMQYSVSNLNVFIILVSIGFTLYLYVDREKQDNNISERNLIDQNNSPIQLINQMKGYFFINPFIAISLSITLFSFVGVPPVIGFFAKQMVLSAALDNGYVFMVLVAIITSVIGAGYYLNVVKIIFFYKEDYSKINSMNKDSSKSINSDLVAYLVPNKEEINNFNLLKDKITFTQNNIVLNSSFSIVISILTLLLLLFIYTPDLWFNMINILALGLFR